MSAASSTSMSATATMIGAVGVLQLGEDSDEQPVKEDVVMGTVVIRPSVESAKWNAKQGVFVPHILLVVDYQTGRLKIPGGAVEVNELLPSAMRREFKEETGMEQNFDGSADGKSLFKWTFKKESVQREKKKGGKYRVAQTVHYFLRVLPCEPSSPQWRPFLRQKRMGETAGLAWLPLEAPNMINPIIKDAFPYSAFLLSNPAYDSAEADYYSPAFFLWTFARVIRPEYDENKLLPPSNLKLNQLNEYLKGLRSRVIQ